MPPEHSDDAFVAKLERDVQWVDTVRRAERKKIVAWLRGAGLNWAADNIEDATHENATPGRVSPPA